MTITDEMVELGANSDARFDGFQGGLQDVPRQRKDRYRNRARAALTAALGDSVMVPREAAQDYANTLRQHADYIAANDGLLSDLDAEELRAVADLLAPLPAAPAAAPQDSTP